MNINKSIIICILPLFTSVVSSCKKFVDIPFPTTEVAKDDVFSSDITANAAQLAVFSQITGSSLTEQISRFSGLSADEFKNYSTASVAIEMYSNGLVSTNSRVSGLWNLLYKLIYQTNSVLEGTSKSLTLTPSVKTQITGEAKFARAFFYFYLVNLFGDVPYLTTTNYNINSTEGRTSNNVVYENIINDLKDAQTMLSNNYLNGEALLPTTERLRPTKSAATAFLARVYLYQGDWQNAEIQASSVISNPAYAILSDLTQVFLKNSSEAIWQTTGSPTFNTWEGNTYILAGKPSNVALSTSLLDSFKLNDKRRTNWVGSVVSSNQTYYYPLKYKVRNSTTVAEYTVIFRLAEQYLIRAEARAQQNKISEAQSDLNKIRTRAGLPNTMANDKSSLLQAIQHESQIELFTELGHRWLNLKRTNMADSIMINITPQKGGIWNHNQQLYPIPQNERNLNPNLSQNVGY
jgi:starch-binding outer membrane protein, SusD/RagB family